MKAFEVNFDGIVGPTHNYSGLSYGNVASIDSSFTPSNPRQAALQGLFKMKYLMDLGLKQAVLPPQERPHLMALRSFGFHGSDAEVLKQAFTHSPKLFYACYSASSMWAANAATISPSSDTLDGRVHITPANLISKFHRSLEHTATSRVLRAIFHDPHFFVHHPILPCSAAFSDEGAANHTSFCKAFGMQGVELFVYGRSALEKADLSAPKLFPARHTLEASQAIARVHQLDLKRVVFAQQHPEAIDAGVFHNDVISVGHRHLFFYHEKAFVNTDEIINELQNKIGATCHIEPIFIKVTDNEVPLRTAVTTYLFNSQIVTLPDNSWHLIAPLECQEEPRVKKFIDSILEDPKNPIDKVHYFNLRESMRNGGGPACLRIRVVLTEEELAAIPATVLLTDKLYQPLVDWVQRHYREKLVPEDLVDPSLHAECQKALEELAEILGLESIKF